MDACDIIALIIDTVESEFGATAAGRLVLASERRTSSDDNDELLSCMVTVAQHMGLDCGNVSPAMDNAIAYFDAIVNT